MAETAAKRPEFMSLFLADLREEYDARGPIALVPLWPLLFLGVGAAIAWRIPEAFFGDSQWSVSTAFYGVVVTFNGLILALSWQAFARIQASICSPGFSGFLRRKKLLEGYFFLIDYIQLAQVLAVVGSAVGLVSILEPRLMVVTDRVVLALAIATSAYGLKQGLGAVTLMNDLIWAHAVFDDEPKTQPGNVSTFPAGGRGVV